ncbi:hypothetical protein PR048_011514 [Dryococelus australis]|uniref:HTH CENPB-type domain-containing protein n=1 Tax=Dryococelus australis TaxID=614101 RepID=A0ABQ9HLV1_9NEOP|nr:hypothetical protein PR048_011514 [Dryococelus australis]
MPPVKMKHVTLTLKKKLENCKMLERGVKVLVIKNEYSISETTVYNITKNMSRRKLLMIAKCSTQPNFKIWTVHCIHNFPQNDLKVLQYRGPIFSAKGKEFYEKLKLTVQCTSPEGWLTRFKNRHRIRKLDVSGKQKPADVEAADKFHACFTQFQVYSAYETSLLWKCLPNTTLAGGNETSTSGFKLNKEHITVLVVKLAMFGKYAKSKCLKMKHIYLLTRAQSNAWMNAEIFLVWFKTVFVPSIKENRERKEHQKTAGSCCYWTTAVLILGLNNSRTATYQSSSCHQMRQA